MTPDPPAASTRLADTVALWYVDRRDAADIVNAACDALGADLDGSALAELAAVPVTLADEQVPPLLEAALGELGLDHHHKGSRRAQEAGLLVMAAEVLTGRLPPRALATWAWRHCGQDLPELARLLAALGDRYDRLLPVPAAEVELDAEVRAEARRVLARPPEGRG